MNQLTRLLVKETLGEQKIIALYGGSFKPPTKGHFNVVKETLQKYPEIDELIVYVGRGERDGVTQEESIKIWDIYKNYLSDKVIIKPAVAPIKAILNYAKENPTQKVYWILGARECQESDFTDIACRTKSVTKYPNIEVKIITSSGGVSGTKTRQAVKTNDKQLFFSLIPDVNEKEEIWDMVKPLVKETKTRAQVIKEQMQKYNKLDEGKQVGPLYHYTSADGLKGILSSNRMNASEEYYLGNDLYYISFTRNKNFHKKGSKFGVKTDYRITLDGDKLSNRYKITPFAYRPGWNYEDNWEYDWLEDEPENVVRDFFNNTGDYDEQEERISFKGPEGGIDNIKNYILAVDKVKDLQEGRKKKPDPKKGTGKKPEGSGRRLYTDEDPKDTVRIKFKTKEDIVDTLNKASFKAKSHARQSQIINLIHQRVRAAYGKAKDPETKARLKRGLDYIEKRKEMSKKKTERLRKMKEATDPQAGTALPYGSGFGPVKENKDYFGLKLIIKEIFEDEQKDIDFKQHLKSLIKYMIKQGLNIKPLPKIIIISNDKQNASSILGKTAYYDPNNKSITLYTKDRHPKDVMRSFSHEMIHHIQNVENRLNNIATTNTNEDGDLPEIEREAYEKGNMMFRNWEDSIKNV